MNEIFLNYNLIDEYFLNENPARNFAKAEDEHAWLNPVPKYNQWNKEDSSKKFLRLPLLCRFHEIEQLVAADDWNIYFARI